MSCSKRYGYRLTLLLIDVDDFKKINDVYGHEKGNEVLKRLAVIISGSVRDSDYAARYGGEEFAVILPQTSLNDGYLIADRLRQNIFAHSFDVGKASVSIGASTYPSPSTSKETLIQHADKAMYWSKANGKNKVTVYQAEK